MIAACFTPTDPVLSNAIVQGPYAERNVRAGIRYLIAAERYVPCVFSSFPVSFTIY